MEVNFKTVRNLFLGLGAALLAPAWSFAEPETVPSVDVGRYLGTWYQISHIPMFFEGGNCACARQVLSARQDGDVNVFNSCNKNDRNGELQTIRGTAHNDDPASNAKFTVDFGLPYKGTYWIVGLDPDYRFAVVTDKMAYSLYILSKTPTLAPDLYQQAVQIATDKKLRVEKLEMTPQESCQYPAEQ